MSRARLARLLFVLSPSVAGCTSVLGLDPPTLAQCLDGGCSDATAHDAAVDASAETAPDATPDSGDTGTGESSCASDAAPDVIPPGVMCGGGCFGVTYCTSPNPVCCQQTDDAGVTTYACTASESTCSGYSIVCANDDDCPGTDICCHFASKMTCDSTTNCPSQDLVCRPWMPIDCPTGKACDVQADNAGVPSPYYLCEP